MRTTMLKITLIGRINYENFNVNFLFRCYVLVRFDNLQIILTNGKNFKKKCFSSRTYILFLHKHL